MGKDFLDKQDSSHERRRHKRFKIHLDVLFRIDKPPFARISLGEKEIESIALDLSEGGIAILSEHDIPVLSLLSIDLRLDRPSRKAKAKSFDLIKIEGRVQYNLLTEDGKHRLGIIFLDIGKEDTEKIAAFVKTGVHSQEEPYIF